MREIFGHTICDYAIWEGLVAMMVVVVGEINCTQIPDITGLQAAATVVSWLVEIRNQGSEWILYWCLPLLVGTLAALSNGELWKWRELHSLHSVVAVALLLPCFLLSSWYAFRAAPWSGCTDSGKDLFASINVNVIRAKKARYHVLLVLMSRYNAGIYGWCGTRKRAWNATFNYKQISFIFRLPDLLYTWF